MQPIRRLVAVLRAHVHAKGGITYSFVYAYVPRSTAGEEGRTFLARKRTTEEITMVFYGPYPCPFYVPETPRLRLVFSKKLPKSALEGINIPQRK